MSIELYVELTRPVLLGKLLPQAAGVLAEILGLSSAPGLSLQVLDNGQRRSVVNDELRDESSPQFLVSIVGEAETVDILVPRKHVSVSMAYARTNLEYALGAAVAIALARELGGHIEDDWRFFGGDVQVSPEDLLRRLKIATAEQDYRKAAEHLNGKLGGETRSA